MKRFEAIARALRSLAQGAIAAGAVAAWQAGQSALAGGGFQPRVIVVTAVAAFVTAAVSYVYNLIAPRLGVADSPRVEALVRAGRTLLAGTVSAGLLAGWEAVYSAVQSGTYSPWILATAGASATVTAVIAFVHNAVRPRTVAE